MTRPVLAEMLGLGAASDEEHVRIGRMSREPVVDRLAAVGEGARGIHKVP